MAETKKPAGRPADAKQRKLKFPSSPKDYLALPATELLEEYGSGGHIPGSGSAAAFSALIGLEMIRTVCKRTLAKEDYSSVHRRMQLIISRVEKIRPRLVELFQKDIDCFDKVSKTRTKRDTSKEKTEKEKLRIRALSEQQSATEIPIEIAEISLRLLELANAAFEEGYRAVRGDAGVAISNLLSAVSGSMFVVFLNLKDYQAKRWEKWRTLQQDKADDILFTFRKYQSIAFEKVLELQKEGVSIVDGQLTLFDEGTK